MLQSIALVLFVAVVVFGWSKLRSELKRLDEEERQAQVAAKKQAQQTVRKKGTETLKKDPETGVYRLDDE